MASVNSFKPEVIIKACVVAAGRNTRLSSAIVVEDASGCKLFECARYWGPYSMQEVEMTITRLGLELAKSLRFEKLAVQLSFASPFPPAPAKPGAKLKCSREQKHIWDLLQGFRLHTVEAPAPMPSLAYAKELAASLHPYLNKQKA